MSAPIRSFAPVIREDARVLILGSMPGAASLAAGQYYAHPRNQFWPIMERLWGAGHALAYEARLGRLQQQGVALWDVLACCLRRGSLDAAIAQRGAVVNDLPGLLHRHRGIVLLCCNGAAAHRILLRHHGAELAASLPWIRCVRLPSTSPANAGASPAEKLEAWRAAVSRV
jgi:double-stranded uracil-DNA glycosylase